MSSRSAWVLSIDEGTTSARAALYNQRGERIAMHAIPFESRYPQPGWVEQDATEILARADVGGEGRRRKS